MKNLLLAIFCTFPCAFAYAQCGSPSYLDPQFTISVQNPACPLVGEIRVVGASDGIAPYTFTLMPNNISNSSGVFTNLPAGSYIIQMRDACGTVRSRQGTIVPYNFSTASTMTPLGCRNFQFNISCSTTGPALEYGYSYRGSPTIIWGDSSTIELTLDAPNLVSLYVRDSCGNVASSDQPIYKEMNGYIKELQERLKCNGLDIYPVYYGFEAPTVCLYTYPQRTLVSCSQAPAGGYNGGAATNFLDLPYGQEWYVIVQDACYRDSMWFPDKRSKGGSELNPFNWKCSTFDLHSDGNNSDSICLYNAATNQLVSCKVNDTTSINPHTGLPWPYGGAEWYDLPYGEYYSYIYDPCSAALIKIDTTVRYPRSPNAQMYYHCSVSQSAVGVGFSPESPAPYSVTILYPDGSVAANYSSGGYLLYPTWPLPGTITVIQEDGCGHKDTSQVFQPSILPTRSVSFKGGCPGINGNSGGGDVLLSGNSYAYGGRGPGGATPAPIATVTIIKKDSTVVNIPQSYTQWNNLTFEQEFYFTNLSTGVYVIESSIGCYGFKVYDTVEVKPYVYPMQNQTNITQCGLNPFVFKDTITGGVGPFSYEIVSTTANMPALLSGPQTSNVFAIPPGTNLSTITLQVVDACGNSDMKVYPVNHAPDCTTLRIDSAYSRVSVQSEGIAVYPNPSQKQFTISFFRKKKTDYQLCIYNVAGIKVYSRMLKDIDTREVLVNENFRPGTYVIQVIDVRSSRQFYQKHVIL